MFSPNRGLRKASIADINNVSAPANSWSVEISTEFGGYKNFLSTNVQNGRRSAKIDGSPVNSLSKFSEILWLLWVVPDMDGIFINSMSDRRSFLDHLVGGFDPRHRSRLKKLLTLQQERLQVMLRYRDERWVRVLEQNIAEESIKVTKSRLEFIEQLEKIFAQHPSKFLRPRVAISGMVEDIFANFREEDAMLELMEKLQQNRTTDFERQTTSIGVYKTRWDVMKNSLDAENCSTGEQKAFLISLILGAMRIYKSRLSGTPILLLDDLMMHLDQTRRGNLSEELLQLDVQTFLSGTDEYLFRDFAERAQFFHVQKSMCQCINKKSF